MLNVPYWQKPEFFPVKVSRAGCRILESIRSSIPRCRISRRSLSISASSESENRYSLISGNFDFMCASSLSENSFTEVGRLGRMLSTSLRTDLVDFESILSFGASRALVSTLRSKCKQQTSVVHHAPFDVCLRITAYFFPIDNQVVAASESGSHAQLGKRIDYRLRKGFEIKIHSFCFRSNDGWTVQVVQVVIHGSAARYTPYKRRRCSFTYSGFDFFDGVLVFSHDDSRLVDPENENLVVMQ